MVLKKSNSSLNSGATQRVSKGGFINPSTPDSWQRSSGVVDIEFWVASDEAKDEVKACLEQINEYLGFSGLDFSRVYNKMHETMYRFHWTSQSTVSLSKGGNWDLRQRIKELVNDVEFLKEVSDVLDINVTEISKEVTSSYFGRVTKTTTSSQILKAFESEERERERAKSVREGISSRKKQTYHGRGIQRGRVAKTTKKFVKEEEPEEDENTKAGVLKSSLTFTFHEPCVVDPRAGELLSHNRERRGEKSLEKSKGYVHGYRAEERESSFKIKEGSQNSDLDIQQVEEFGDLGLIEGDIEEELPKPSSSLNLADFIQSGKPSKRGRNMSKNSKDSLSEEENTTCDKLQHPKGSYTYIKHFPDVNQSLSNSLWDVIESSEGLQASETGLADSVQGNMENIANDKAVPESSEKRPFEVLSKSDKTFLDFMKRDFDIFTKSFTQVQVLTPGDGVSAFHETSDMLELTLKGRLNVTVGNSVPHCFCVSSPKNQTKSYVIVRQASKDGSTWLLSLQGSSESQDVDFWNSVSQLHQSNEEISLNDIITVAEKTLMEVSECQEVKSVESETILAKCKHTKFDNHIGELATVARQEVGIYTAEEAAEQMQAGTSQPQQCETTKKLSDLSLDTLEDIECGVCFSSCNLHGKCGDESAIMLTSCGHAHCTSCWRTHVYHTIRNGAPRITCMATGCDTVMDETTLKCLVPATQVRSWQARLRDRLLQTSNFTSWCPDGQCGHIAVSSRAPLKKQFGSPLVCSCSRHWCSNCQEDPHWPASCDQMAAYKKLLSKTGNTFEVPGAHATYKIEVKKCPFCNYPMEKSYGCPWMLCIMCNYNFCWVCLQSTDEHNPYYCDDYDLEFGNSITFDLNNKLVCNLPIKFLMESLRANKEGALLCNDFSWLEKLRANSFLKFAYLRKLPARTMGDSSQGVDVDSLFELIDETLAFLRTSFDQIELFYVLLGFAQLNKTKSTTYLTADVKRKIARLHFIMDRLKTLVVGKSLPHISAEHKRAWNLLKTGVTILQEMYNLAPLLQQASKEVETAWVGDIDPSEHFHYL